jgi:Flp pilus assembly protein TadD
VLDDARKRKAADARTAFYSGLVHERLRAYAKAERAFGEVAEDSDLFDEARLHRAACLSLDGVHDRALRLLEKALQDKPARAAVNTAYARALERSGASKKAEQFLLSQISSHPEGELYEALAQTYQRQGRGNEAIQLLRRAVENKPQDEALLYALGTAHERQGDLENALKRMREVLELNPQNAAAMNFIGYVLAERGRELDEAEGLLLKALALRPDNGAFLDSLGWVYYRRGEYERAVSLLERATALAPGEALIIEHLGDAYVAASRKPQAQDAYLKAIEAIRHSPDPPDDAAQRGNLERKLKKLSTEAAGR